jgi:hypothetical protein
MTYTIKISDKSKKAKSIINMLKSLREDYDFIEISEEKKEKLSIKISRELRLRYDLFSKNPNGKDWDELKKELMSK